MFTLILLFINVFVLGASAGHSMGNKSGSDDDPFIPCC